MVEVSRWGSAKRTIYCRNAQQNTARIARTAMNVAICRAFLRSVLVMLYRPLMDRYRPPS